MNKMISAAVVSAVLLTFAALPREAKSTSTIPPFEPATKIAVTLTPRTTYSKTTQAVTYNYTLKSDRSSVQSVWAFAIKYDSPVFDGHSQGYWDAWSFDEEPFFKFNAMDEPYRLKPGTTISGFSFSSKGLPAVQTYHAQGDAPMPEIPEDTPEGFNEKEFAIATDFFHNSVKAHTVGPAAITTAAPAPDIIAFMLAQIKAVTELGWIDNRGIENELEKKLEGALAAVNKGKTKTTRNKLKAFLHDVREKSGKHEEKEDEGKREREEARAHIKQNAVAILATNAEVAICALGGDPKKSEDDD